jgi:hypothetical protein
MLPLFAIGGGAAPVFDITTLAWSGLWRASYSGAPWAGVASAGVSGTTGNLAAGTAPTTGTAQNGLTPAAFAAASSQYLTNATAVSTVFTHAAGSIVALVYGVSAVAAAGNPYDDPAIFVDQGTGSVGLTHTASGFKAFLYDGVSYKTRTAAAATGSYHLVMLDWDASTLGLTLNSGARDSIAIAGGGWNVNAGNINVGRGYLTSAFIDARILMVGCSASQFSAGNYANIKSYVNSTYALSL